MRVSPREDLLFNFIGQGAIRRVELLALLPDLSMIGLSISDESVKEPSLLL